MNPRTFIITAAVALIFVAGFLLNTTVHATTPAGGTVVCGTALTPDNSDGQHRSDQIQIGNGLNVLAGTNYPYQANQYVGFEAACTDALDTRSMWGWVVGGVALVALLGAVLVRRPAA